MVGIGYSPCQLLQADGFLCFLTSDHFTQQQVPDRGSRDSCPGKLLFVPVLVEEPPQER